MTALGTQRLIADVRLADTATPAVERIVGAIRRRVNAAELPTGARLPSVRGFAGAAGVSRHAVVEAYDRLQAEGYVVSRRGAGFFVAEGRRRRADPIEPERQRAYDVAWLIREVLEADETWLKVGGPWLPESWLDLEALQSTIRGLGRGEDVSHLTRYGPPLGYLPLRQQLRQLAAELGIEAPAGQLLTTAGGSHALDLVVRQFVRPGDAVLVEDPGYYNLFGYLRFTGARLLGVPRREDGPDVAALRALAAEHRPRLFFTQSALQNPTGSTTSPAVAYRLLEAARDFDLTLIEDDTYADLDPSPWPRLASLDRLERVIYLRSFSKALSGSLRVGFLAASPAVIEALANLKVLSQISTSLFSEKLVFRLIAEGHYRRYLERVRARLGDARAAALALFAGAGMQVFVEPRGGNLLWARFPGVESAKVLAERARSQGVILGVGDVFRPNLEPSPWMRFNVTLCDDPRIARFINQVR
jgi:DNA-binding transcriptional MocR family regulator